MPDTPPGVMEMYGGDIAPAGWLMRDGSAVSRTTYAALFAAIGTKFGAGDGSTTFNLPDARGRSPLGAGQGNTAEGGGLGTNRAVGATGGAETHTLTTAQLPAHSHGISGQTISTGGASPAFTTGGSAQSSSTQSAGSGQAHNNMHPFLAVNFIIKT